MLLNKFIKVKVSNRTKKYFLEKGYIEDNGYFMVLPEDMNDSNRTKVKCECEYCGVINDVTWSNYILQMNKAEEKIYSCHKCHFNKTKIIFMKNYGVDNIQILDQVKNKIKKTCMEKYGVDCVLKSKKIKDKIKNIFIEKYGVDHPMKNEKIFNKAQKNSYRTIKYKETELYYKGTYELDFIEYCIKNEINIENGPTIKYKLCEKERVYYSDFLIRDINLIVEVKSTYTYCDYDENIAKMKYTIENGYNFIFIIDKDYTDFEKIINS